MRVVLRIRSAAKSGLARWFGLQGMSIILDRSNWGPLAISGHPAMSRPAFYRTLLSRTRFLRIVAAGIGLCAITVGDPSGPPSDPRPENLARFFESYNCPRPWHIDAYMKAADQYQIDYRFLPVVSVMESTCGRHQRYSNWWGWNSADTGFSSVAEGIDYIGSRLAESPYYRGLTVEEKLYAYNPYEEYVEKAKRLMASIEQPD